MVDPVSVADNAPPLPALRRDLEWIERDGAGSGRWIARDPVSLEYYSFSDTERQAALLLDGVRGFGQILALLQPVDQHGTWTASRLRVFVARLEQSCLLRPARPGGGSRLWLRRQLERRRGRLAWLASPLIFRIPLFDPGPFLRHAGWPARLLFNRWVAAFWLMALVAVAVQVLPRMLAEGRLTTTFRFLSGENLLWLAVAWAAVKSLHELGHLLACRRWNAECHECGVWMLFLVPSLYCDTSDAWKLPSRWQRASIGAAGVYMESIIATLAGLAWLWQQPGLARDLCTNVMVICTAGTCLLNGNPLLRYDGYYILSDLWGVPNLADQSREVVRGGLLSWLTGTPLPRERWDARPAGLALYGIASWLYRQMVLVLILWAAWRMLDAWGLPLAALVVTGLMVSAIALGWIRLLTGFALEVAMDGRGRLPRLGIAVLLMGVVVWALFQVPWPSGVTARGFAARIHPLPVFAPEAGVLLDFHPVDREVRQSDPLARIDAPELRMQLQNLDHRAAVLAERRDQLRLLSVDDERAALELPALEEQLADLQRQRSLLAADLAALEIRAPASGWFWRARTHVSAALADPARGIDHGPRRAEREPGSTVSRGELLGWIGQRDAVEIRVLVPEREGELIRVGSVARCRWDACPGETVSGRVRSISAEPVVQTPDALAGDPRFLSARDGAGRLVPVQPCYEIVIEIPPSARLIPNDSLATVWIDRGTLTAVQFLRRIIQQNFLPGNPAGIRRGR